MPTLYCFIFLVFCNILLKAQTADTSFYKGKNAFEVGNYSLAITYFNTTLSKNKKYKLTNYLIGLAYFNLKEYNAAYPNFKKEIKVNPNFINAYLFKAKVNETFGKNKRALRTLKKALKLDSVNVLLVLEKANIYFIQTKYNKAIKSYLKVLRLSPKLELAYYKLGFCEYYKNNKTMACDYWAQIQDLDDFENYQLILKTCNLTL